MWFLWVEKRQAGERTKQGEVSRETRRRKPVEVGKLKRTYALKDARRLGRADGLRERGTNGRAAEGTRKRLRGSPEILPKIASHPLLSSIPSDDISYSTTLSKTNTKKNCTKYKAAREGLSGVFRISTPRRPKLEARTEA